MVFHGMPRHSVKGRPISCNLLLEEVGLGRALNTYSGRLDSPLPHSWGIGELPKLNLYQTPKCNPCLHSFFFKNGYFIYISNAVPLSGFPSANLLSLSSFPPCFYEGTFPHLPIPTSLP